MSLNPAHVNSYSVEQLEERLQLMKDSLQKPVLAHVDSGLTPDEFMRLPAKRIELVDGVVVEKPHVSFNDAVRVANLAIALFEFVTRNKLGQTASGGSFEDLIGENTDELLEKAPTLAVQIVSFHDADGAFDDKAAEFLCAGSRSVWVINPRHRTVAVHAPNGETTTYWMGETIPGGAILPAFELPVAETIED